MISKPVIQLEGNANIYTELGSPYVELGYSAADEADGDLTSEVIVTGTVNNNELGIYPLKYNVINSRGN